MRSGHVLSGVLVVGSGVGVPATAEDSLAALRQLVQVKANLMVADYRGDLGPLARVREQVAELTSARDSATWLITGSGSRAGGSRSTPAIGTHPGWT